MKIDSINQIQFTDNRRVVRLEFSQLASNFVFVDPTAVSTGNPRLRPAFANNWRIAWTRPSFYWAFEYTHTQNYISFHSMVDKERNLQTSTPFNFDKFSIASATISMPVHKSSWSDIHFTAVGQWRQVENNDPTEGNFRKKKTNLLLQYTQSVNYSKYWSAEINATRLANALDEDQIKFDILRVSLGLRKTLCRSHFKIRLK